MLSMGRSRALPSSLAFSWVRDGPGMSVDAWREAVIGRHTQANDSRFLPLLDTSLLTHRAPPDFPPKIGSQRLHITRLYAQHRQQPSRGKRDPCSLTLPHRLP
jgi:hypothetical protein